MDIKDLAELAIKAGGVPDPKVTKVDVQVRTGTMFPLPDWMDAPDQVQATEPKAEDSR